ncbi:MAG: TolC family protein [Flavobacteriaceae bacterium]|nr:TolC family protein [Flavobacteriaceae bacterium]
MKILALFLLCLSFSVEAQVLKTKTLTLKDAVEYALQNKADAKKAQLDIENSHYQIVQARANLYPTVSVSGNLLYNPILQEMIVAGDVFGQSGQTMILTLGKKWGAQAGVSVTQNIFNQRVFVGLKEAETTREFYRINAKLTDEQVIERIAIAYYSVFVQKYQLATIENSYTFTKKTRNVIKSLWNNGLAKKIDLDRVDVQLANISSEKTQLVNAVQLYENVLKFYMGMPITQSIELADEDFQVNSVMLDDDDIDVEDLTAFKVLEKQEELLMLNKRAAKSRYFPTLALQGGYNYIGQSGKFLISKEKNNDILWSDYSQIVLALNIPIFNGFATRAAVYQADVGLRKLQLDIADAKLGLELDYQNSKSQVENNYASVQSQKENVQLAQQVLNNTQNNYLKGLANLTDLIEAQNTQVQAKNNYSNAVLQFKIAEIQLLKAKGGLNTLIQ